MSSTTSRQTLPLYTVDAFSDVPFGGNQAAVCLDHKGLSDEMYQSIAAEMNISETAFVRPLIEGDTFQSGRRFGLRWFTPTTEVPLCGHATLASASVLFNCIGNKHLTITFETRFRGDLNARSSNGKVCMDLPLGPTQPENREDYTDLLKFIFGALPIEDVQFSPLTSKLLVRLSDTTTRAELEALRVPDGARMQTLHAGKVRGVIATVRAALTDAPQTYDFYSRYFAPWVGIPEDPVTGSAHTVLAPYWADVLGKADLKARQCSPRGGDLELHMRSDGRVDITGASTVIIRGQITI